MPYALGETISKSPIEGGIEISEQQYADAFAAKLAGREAVVLGDNLVVRDPAPSSQHKWEGEKWVEPEAPEPTPIDPNAPYTLYKSTLIRRLTEQEATTLKALLDSSPDKMQMLWDASEWLGSDDPLFATLNQAISGALGEDRAAEILAREE